MSCTRTIKSFETVEVRIECCDKVEIENLEKTIISSIEQKLEKLNVLIKNCNIYNYSGLLLINDRYNVCSDIIRKGNYKLFLQFLDGVKPQGEIKKTRLTGKSLCISMNYEYCHFREMLAIIQLLTNQGAQYKMKASLNDIFVSYIEKDETGKDRYCSRLKYVSETIQEGKHIEIITFSELLEILGIEETGLKAYPFPEESCFVKRPKPKVKQNSKSRDYKESASGISIGELLKAKGLDINNL